MNLLIPRLLIFGVVTCCTGCRREMADQPRFEPFEASNFFPDGAASRPLPAHTIARGFLREDERFYTGKSEGVLVATLPVELSRELLERGRQRYTIYCSVCHGAVGDGRGMIAQRGFPPPPSFHLQRLREAPIGYFFEVITNGFGLMYPYGSRVEPRDRWGIAAYVRALQLSQGATLEDVEPAMRAKLEAERP